MVSSLARLVVHDDERRDIGAAQGEVERQYEGAQETLLVEVPVELGLQRHMVAEHALVDDLHRHVIADDLASCLGADLALANELIPMVVDQCIVIEDSSEAVE